MYVCVHVRDSSCLSEFARFEYDPEHRVRVGVLIRALQCLSVRPSAGLGHVHIGQVLPLRRPLPAVGVPERATLRLEPRERLGFA